MKSPLDIGSRRELFVDSYLIEELIDLDHLLQTPKDSWDEMLQNYGGYVTVIQDENSYKRYYRTSFGDEWYDGHPGELTCVEISSDGINWNAPELDMYKEVDGHKNIILMGDPPRSHNFSPFLDKNSSAGKKECYKALSGTHKDDHGRPDTAPPLQDIDSGLYAFSSPDGLHWKKMADYPVITFSEFSFDSQNVSFWSELEQCYVCYFRCWEENPSVQKETGKQQKITMWTHLRSIARTTSQDFIHWTEPVRLKPNFPDEHLYTSQTHPYYRANHIYIALPTRYMQDRASSTDIMFMSARGEVKFDRTFTHAFVKPGNDPAAWGNRSNYANLNIYQTSDNEMSFYVRGIRRVLRIDGFASLKAYRKPGTLITKPFIFEGNQLTMNYATSAAGSLQVSFIDSSGKELPGLGINDCAEVVGDEIDGNIPFRKEALEKFSGKPVRMKVILQDSELYAFKFS
jgi:hypothetical protein